MPFHVKDSPLRVSSTPTADPPPFAFNPAETMLYCNNPEQIYPEDLGDEAPGLGAHYLLWSYVTGSCQAYFEHQNSTGMTIGYGLQVVNPSPNPVIITVTNTGLASGPFGCWDTFFSGAASPFGSVGSREVPPGGVLWLMRADGAFGAGDIFNGVVRFTVSGGYVYVLNYAYHDFQRINGHATYMGYVRRIDVGGENEARVYKGTSPGFFLTLPLQVSVSHLGEHPMVWQSHACSNNSRGDMRTFTCPAGPPSNPGPALQFGCATGENLGNWGVQYGYDLTLTNDILEPCTVRLGVVPDYLPCLIYAATPEGYGGNSVTPDGWCFYTVPLAPGEVRRILYQVILCGGSCGRITNVLALS